MGILQTQRQLTAIDHYIVKKAPYNYTTEAVNYHFAIHLNLEK